MSDTPISDLLAALAMLSQFAITSRPLVSIGNINDFPMYQPQLLTVENQQLFVVRLGSELVAYDPMVIQYEDTRCKVQWVEMQGRFEDSCGGSKFQMDGTWIEGLAPRNLDYYPVTIDSDGTIRIETWRTIKGEPHP